MASSPAAMVETVRFEDGRPMLLAGPRRKHRFAEVEQTIPQQWQELNRLGRLPGQVGTARYGANAGTDMAAGTFEYMCAVEVEDLAAIPEGVGRMRVPAARYAVFTHEGPVSQLRASWDAVWGWLPSSGVRISETPNFELYDERFDWNTGSGVIELWVAIEGGK